MNIKILDCTLRDGGYYNKWDFEQDTVSRYLKAVRASLVDVVELGFRSLPKTYLWDLLLIQLMNLSIN